MKAGERCGVLRMKIEHQDDLIPLHVRRQVEVFAALLEISRAEIVGCDYQRPWRRQVEVFAALLEISRAEIVGCDYQRPWRMQTSVPRN